MYSVERGSGAMIYMPSFIEIGSVIQQLTSGYTASGYLYRSKKLN
jgi:hypothetical protein